MLRLRTLGELRLSGPEGELLPGRRKELVLLAYLARRAARAVRRGELTDLLWADRDEQRARHSLRQALLALRRAVGEGLEIGRDAVTLRSGVVDLDLSAFEAALAAGRGREAVDLWRGDFLTDTEDAGGEVYRTWLEAERERGRHRLAEALERLAAEAEVEGDRAAELGWAEKWAELLPFDERAHTRLVEALWLDGQIGAARARHAEYAARLRRQLEAEPSPAFVQLGERITRKENGEPDVLASAGSAALFTPDLAGRDPARAELRGAWNAASAGMPSVMVVEAGEGMGKTLLCEELIRALEEQGEPVLVLRARGREEKGDVAEGTIRELFAGIAAAPGLSGAEDDDLAEAARLVPAIRARWPALPAARGGEVRLHRSLAQVLGTVAQEVPVLLFLDDFAYADPESRRAIEALARYCPGGVMLLLAVGTDGREAGRVLGDLRAVPGLRRLRLSPLGGPELDTLLRSMLELPTADRRRLAARLHAETGGNPFYAGEIVSAMVDEGQLSPDPRGIWRVDAAFGERPLPLPATVREAIRRRLDRLGHAARRLVAAAATLPEPIEQTSVAAAADLTPAELQDALDELIGRRLLRYAPARPDALEFVHPLIRRVASGSLRTDETRTMGARPRRTRRRLTAGAAAAAAMVAAAGALVWFGRGAADRAPTLAVAPIRTEAGEAGPDLAGPVGDMLATNLARVPGLQVISNVRMHEMLAQLGGAGLPATPAEAARRAGAVEIVDAALTALPHGRLRLDVRRVDTRTGAVRGSCVVEGQDPFELVDLATVCVTNDLGFRARQLKVADVTTRSLDAYRSYAEGLRSYAAGDYDGALKRFEAALAHDSLFGMAALYAWHSAGALGRSAPLLQRLDSIGARAPDRERLAIGAASAGSMQDPRFVAVAESLAVRYPLEPDGHLLFGLALVQEGDFLKAVPQLRRAIALDSLALRGDLPSCVACRALASITNAYALADSAGAAERIAREWIRLQPGSPGAWHHLGVALAAQGRYAEAITAFRTSAAASQPDLRVEAAVLPAWVHIAAGDYAAAERVLSDLERRGTPDAQWDALWYRTISLRNQGRLNEALETARRREAASAEDNRLGPILQRAQVMFEMGRLRDATRVFDSLAAFPDDRLSGGHLARYKSWMLVHLATTHAAAGDTAAVAALIEPLRAWGPRSSYGRDRRLQHHASGLLLVARGQLEEAVAEFRRAVHSPTLGYTRTNYELGRTLLALGRPLEAVDAVAPALRGPLDGSNLYITHTELHELLGQAYEAAGDDARAAIHFRRVMEAWRNADPGFHARRNAIGARLASIDARCTRDLRRTRNGETACRHIAAGQGS